MAETENMNSESSAGAALAKRAAGLPQSSTVAIADLAAALRRQDTAVVDFSAGRAAEASPDSVCRAAAEAMARGETHQTPARGRTDYLQAVAAKLSRDNGLELAADRHVIATLGCKQGLVLALFSCLDPGDEVIIEDPCFVSYEPTIRLAGGVPVRVPLRPQNHYRWSAGDLAAAVSDKTKAMLFCSPHNPTGTVHSGRDLQIIADFAISHDLVVIADEIYEAVAWGGRKHIPLAGLPGMQSRTIGLMGLTKTYSMGGWRIGYAYSSQPIIDTMVVLQQHLMTCAGSFTQAGAAAALSASQTEAMAPLWQDWQERCHYLTTALNDIPALRAAMPEGGFYAWVDIADTGLDSMAFSQRLLSDRHVAVVPGRAFGEASDRYVRATCVRSWDELREGVRRIGEFAAAL